MATPTGQVYTYHYNGIGSTIAMTDAAKNVVNKYFYTPFGLLTNQEENVSQPFKFAGQHGVMYESNGFYYMRARYYDPSIGRFISEDPSGFDGGDVNLYAYCNDNPINRVDPSGLEGRSSIYAPDWMRAGVTPEQALRWSGRILQEGGYGISGRVMSIVGAAIEPGGTGRLTGMITGGTIGAGIGGSFGPVGAVAGGIIGGTLGAYGGGQFDYPGAGQLNYREWEGYGG